MDIQPSAVMGLASASPDLVDIPIGFTADSGMDVPALQPILQGFSRLRLQVPSGVIGTLRQAPVIVKHARNRGVVRRLDSIYYDSSDFRLSGGLLSLRVQKNGKRFLQTLRHHGDDRHGLPGQMWQTPLDGPTPDLSQLAGIPMIERLGTPALVALFETRLRRHVQRLELPGAVVDVAFDEGVIVAGSQQEPWAEIRLTHYSGDASLLYEIGMRLLEWAPVRASGTRIGQRGYALASGVAIKAEKAALSTLTPDFVVDDMVAAVLGGCQSHLLANQAVAIDGRSPDGVHQMRVALRRLRSAFSLLRREIPSATMLGLSQEAKWAADQLGAARSWDVFLTTTLAAPSRHCPPGVDFGALREAAEAPRAAGYVMARAMIDADRYNRFQLSLGQWIARRGWRNDVGSDGLGVLAEPASEMARRVLARLHRKALKQGAHFKRLSAAERHELRITLKKLRYAAEFFLPLFAPSAQAHRQMRRLSRLQEALGLDHDAATTQPLLDEIAECQQIPAVHQAIGIVIGWQARDCLAAASSLADHWQRFKALPPFWSRASSSYHAGK